MVTILFAEGWGQETSYDIIHITNQDKKIGLGTRPVWWRDSGSISFIFYMYHTIPYLAPHQCPSVGPVVMYARPIMLFVRRAVSVL